MLQVPNGVPDPFTIPDLPPFPTTSPDRKSLHNPEGISPPEVVDNKVNPLSPGGVNPLNTTRSESDPTLVTSAYNGRSSKSTFHRYLGNK